MQYAKETKVKTEASRAGIERCLARYGADAFATAIDAGRAAIQFRAGGKMIRFEMKLPGRDAFGQSPQGHNRSAEAAGRAYDQAIRQRWRALALCIQAKLEAVECGITTFDQEFLAHIVMPDGRTFGQIALPQIEDLRRSGKMPDRPLIGWQ